MSGSLGFECDSCGSFRIYSADGSPKINCTSCKKNLGTVGENWSLENSCPFCDCQSYYKRKDFNQILGAGIILTGAVLSIIYNYFILIGFALLDILLYNFVPEVAVCYQCSAELRGFNGMDNIYVFDHHKAELYQYKHNKES